MKNKLLPIILLLTHFSLIFGQESGENIFDNDVLHEVRLYFDQANFWNEMLQNFESTPTGGKVPYILADVEIDGELIDSIGVRFKGFTSYQTYSDKKPFKLDFNEFVPGKRYDGLRKLNLNNGTGDPAMQRDNICYKLLRESGVAAPRTSYARIYINDTYHGLYQLIEQVDKEFLKRNFDNPRGNLFKNKSWSQFEWLGTEAEPYAEIFELKTNEDSYDYSGFINLMDIINNSTEEDFKDAIAEVFNVDLFLKTLAIDVATNNWDSFMEHGRNWYIYQDTVTNIFHWIPWDYNFALDSPAFGFDDEECWLFPDFVPVLKGEPEVTFYNNSFVPDDGTYLWDFGDGNTSTEYSVTHTYESHGLYNVCLTIEVDENCFDFTCKQVNTMEDLNDCNSVVDGSFTGDVDIAFALTTTWIPPCCDNWSSECQELFDDIVISTGGGGGFGSSDFIIDQRDNPKVLINRLLAVEEYNESYYNQYCDILDYHMSSSNMNQYIDHNKALIENSIIEDFNYLYDYEEFLEDSGEEGLKSILASRLNNLRDELDSIHNCLPAEEFIPFQDVVINELVASNDSTSMIADQDGEYDDWIELYNNTNSSIDLSGIYLSDSKTDFKKWQFPDGVSIDADDYLIVWADDDTEQDGIHSNFKLGKSGDELFLSNLDGSIIDSISFEDQTTNVAFARQPNGTGPFFTKESTFNDNNDLVSDTDDITFGNVKVFPNPTNGQLNIGLDANVAGPVQVQVYSNLNQLVYENQFSTHRFELDLNRLASGHYTLKLINANVGFTLKKIVKI